VNENSKWWSISTSNFIGAAYAYYTDGGAVVSEFGFLSGGVATFYGSTGTIVKGTWILFDDTIVVSIGGDSRTFTVIDEDTIYSEILWHRVK